MQVAVDALGGRRPASQGGERVERGAQPAVRNGAQRGHGVGRGLQPLGHRRGDAAVPCAPRAAAGGRAASARWHLGGGPAQRRAPRRVKSSAVGERRAAPAPSRPRRRGRNGWSTPSVARSCGSVGRGTRPRAPGTRVQPCPASASGSSRSGLTPGLDPPEELQDERVAVDQRGVGLLGVRAGAARARRAASRRVAARSAAGPMRAGLRAAAPGAAAPSRRVLQGVVDRQPGQRPVVDPADEGGAEPRRQQRPWTPSSSW